MITQWRDTYLTDGQSLRSGSWNSNASRGVAAEPIGRGWSLILALLLSLGLWAGIWAAVSALISR
jgi:hypothetical protein